MKLKLSTAIFLALFFAFTSQGAGIKLTGWTTTTNAADARAALGIDGGSFTNLPATSNLISGNGAGGASDSGIGFSGSLINANSLNAYGLLDQLGNNFVTADPLKRGFIYNPGTSNAVASLTSTGTNWWGTFNGNYYGNGSGLTSLNGSQISSGTIPDARLNTNNFPTSAYSFADINNLSVNARQRIELVEKQLKADGFWSRLIDVAPLGAAYNPTNKFTLMGRTMTGAFTVDDSQFSSGVTNFTTPISFSIPAQTNLTVVIVYKHAPVVDSSAGCVPFAALNSSDNSGYVLLHYAQFYNRLICVTNSVANTDYTVDLIQPQDAVSNITYTIDANYAPAANRSVVMVGLDSAGHTTFWRDCMQGKLGFTSPAYTNTTAPVSSFDKISIGGALTYSNYLGAIDSVFVFSGLPSDTIARSSLIAARALDFQTHDMTIIGDSRNWNRWTNSWDYFLQTSPYFPDTIVYNIAVGGSTAHQWASSTGYTNLLGAIDSCPLSTKSICDNLGINDFAIDSNTTPAQVESWTTIVRNRIPSNWKFRMQTVFGVDPTNTVWTQSTYNYTLTDAHRLEYNNWIITNAPGNWSIIDNAALFDPYVTNNLYTLDGVHIYGSTNSNYLLKQLADMVAKNNDYGLFSGDGSSLTALSGANISAGSVPVTALDTTTAAKVNNAVTNGSATIALSSPSNAVSGTFSGPVEGTSIGLADTNNLFAQNGGTWELFTNSPALGGYYWTNTSLANAGFLIYKVGNFWQYHSMAGGITDGTNFSGSVQGFYASPSGATVGLARFATNNISLLVVSNVPALASGSSAPTAGQILYAGGTNNADGSLALYPGDAPTGGGSGSSTNIETYYISGPVGNAMSLSAGAHYFDLTDFATEVAVGEYAARRQANFVGIVTNMTFTWSGSTVALATTNFISMAFVTNTVEETSCTLTNWGTGTTGQAFPTNSIGSFYNDSRTNMLSIRLYCPYITGNIRFKGSFQVISQ